MAPTREPLAGRERRLWLFALAIAAAIGVWLRWPAVEIGRLSDDYMHHAMIAGLYPRGGPGEGYVPFDLYAFVRRGELAMHIAEGTAPWFADPNYYGAVFRPLSSLLLWLDHTLAPGRVRLWHMHSLLWFVATIFAFGLCARRLLPRWPAALAVALLVCEAGFVSPLGWLANRCVLVSAAFGFAAVYLHLEWRRPDPDTPAWLRRRGPWLELLALALSLAGGEYGLGAAAYILAWELVVGARGAQARAEGWRIRARALLPTVGPLVAYLALHFGLGYGTVGAEVYADPVHAPLEWLEWARLRIPKLCTGALWSLPASTASVFVHPGASWWLSFDPSRDAMVYHLAHARLGWLGIAVVGLGLWLARAGLHVDEGRTLAAMLVGGFASLLPVSVAAAHSRLLILTQLGACTVVALLIFACARLVLGRGPRQGDRPRLARLRGVALLPVALVMLAAHVVGDLRWNQRYLRHLGDMHTQNVLAFSEGDLLEQQLADREVIVLNGPNLTVGMYGHFVLHANGAAAPASWRPLALGGYHPMFAFRRDDRSLELTAIDGTWLQAAAEEFFRRSDEGFAVGDRVQAPGMRAEILAVSEGLPTRVRFRFPHSLDDRRYLFLISTSRGLMRWSVPAVGDRAVVPLPGLPAPSGRSASPRPAARPGPSNGKQGS